ncbi:Actin-4 [Entamoeba marina]
MDDNTTLPLVLDCSSQTSKVGFAGEELPDYFFSTLVGNTTQHQQNKFVGDDALINFDSLNMIQPIENGKVVNWDAMKDIWSYAFNNIMHVESQGSTILLSDYSNDCRQRKSTAQIMFESMNIHKMFISNKDELCMYSAGRCSGIVLYLGEELSSVTPIYEGYALKNNSVDIPINNRLLLDYLYEELTLKGLSCTNTNKHAILNNIQEQCCYVTDSYFVELNKSIGCIDESFTLPDGNIIKLGIERFKCPEMLFQPSLMGLEYIGIHESIHNSIQLCDHEIRYNFCPNIVLSGQGSMYKNIEKRLKNELTELLTLNSNIEVSTPQDRKYAVWIGGSCLASLSTMEPRWITKYDYEENGPSVVQIKCN